jgi:hypothetical protein
VDIEVNLIDDATLISIAEKIGHTINNNKLVSAIACGKILLYGLYQGNIHRLSYTNPYKETSLVKISVYLKEKFVIKKDPQRLSEWIRMAGVIHPLLIANLSPDELNHVTYMHYLYLLQLESDEEKLESAREDTGLTARELYARIQERKQSTGDSSFEKPEEGIFREAMGGLQRTLNLSKQEARSLISKIKPLFSPDEAFTIEEVLEAAISGRRKPKDNGQERTEDEEKRLTDEAQPSDLTTKIAQMIQDTTQRIIKETPLKWNKNLVKDNLRKIRGMEYYFPGPRKITQISIEELKKFNAEATKILEKCVALSVQTAIFVDLSAKTIAESGLAQPVTVSIYDGKLLSEKEIERRTKPLIQSTPKSLTEDSIIDVLPATLPEGAPESLTKGAAMGLTLGMALPSLYKGASPTNGVPLNEKEENKEEITVGGSETVVKHMMEFIDGSEGSKLPVESEPEPST